MALATIEIEQITGGTWVVRIEIGGLVARKVQLAVPTLSRALEGIAESYQAIAPADDVRQQLNGAKDAPPPSLPSPRVMAPGVRR